MIFTVRWGSTGPRQLYIGSFSKPSPEARDLHAKYAGRYVEMRTALEAKIKGSPQDSFVFVLTKAQMDEFNKWLDTTGLRTAIKLETPPSFNPIHQGYGKNLTLFVLQAN